MNVDEEARATSESASESGPNGRKGGEYKQNKHKKTHKKKRNRRKRELPVKLIGIIKKSEDDGKTDTSTTSHDEHSQSGGSVGRYRKRLADTLQGDHRKKTMMLLAEDWSEASLEDDELDCVTSSSDSEWESDNGIEIDNWIDPSWVIDENEQELIRRWERHERRAEKKRTKVEAVDSAASETGENNDERRGTEKKEKKGHKHPKRRSTTSARLFAVPVRPGSVAFDLSSARPVLRMACPASCATCTCARPSHDESALDIAAVERALAMLQKWRDEKAAWIEERANFERECAALREENVRLRAQVEQLQKHDDSGEEKEGRSTSMSRSTRKVMLLHLQNIQLPQAAPDQTNAQAEKESAEKQQARKGRKKRWGSVILPDRVGIERQHRKRSKTQTQPDAEARGSALNTK